MNSEPKHYLGPEPDRNSQLIILRELFSKALDRSWDPENEAKERAKLNALIEYFDQQGIDAEAIAADLKEQRIDEVAKQVADSTGLEAQSDDVHLAEEVEVDRYNSERASLIAQLTALYKKQTTGEMTDEDYGALAVVVEDMRTLEMSPEFIIDELKRADSA